MNIQGQTGEMVQPTEGPGVDYAPSGGGPGNSLLGMPDALPHELANHELFQRLLAENQDLRDALQQSNTMLRKRHTEMLALQDAQRNEHQFIASRFSEARDLVQNLTKERNSLQAQLELAKKQLHQVIAKEEHAPGRTEVERRQLAEVSDTRHPANKNEEDNTSPGSSLSSCETLTHSMCETIRKSAPDLVGPTRSEQIETGDRDARTEVDSLQGAGERNIRLEQEFQRKLQEAEDQEALLQQQIVNLQGEMSELRLQMAEKTTESQRQLQLLAEEKVSVKAQVTSLLGELKESQLSLETSTQEKRKLEESIRSTRDQQKEWEAQVKQHVIQLDQRRLQVQNLEAALKIERQNACEEMRKLAQLQAAYHQLFQEYDAHIKKSLQLEKCLQECEVQVADLTQQLQEAEEALVAKQELIDKLKQGSEEVQAKLDRIPVLEAQVSIYHEDFQQERAARGKLHEEKEKLQEEKEKLLKQLEDLQRERTRFQDMLNRHVDNQLASQPGHYPNPGPPAFVAEPHEFCCPKCQYIAPDMDTLQIHVMDCIQ
ncbi:NF-kappa-B essential modulator isoform X1 [Pelobates cultripes]|uniref:NF-kappa-B essential modulator n=1 Tax=Pelobates cultripes TaxID=61616 RepID=A0AAD1T1M7_PELCU|nr:NF-kappa-B essential modulator isoform X1 [Pelobates cultripes]